MGKDEILFTIGKYLFLVLGIGVSWMWQGYLLDNSNYTAWIVVYGMFYFFVILLLAVLTDEFMLKGDSLGEIAKDGYSSATFFSAIIVAAIAATFIASTFITDPFGTRSGLPVEESAEPSATFTVQQDTLPHITGEDIPESED